MKSISVTDLVLIPELSHLNFVEIISKVNDYLVLPFLEQLGIDTDYPVSYMPCQHRNMQGKVVISYLVVGELQINRSYLSSEYADTTDLLVASSYTDRSLTKELCGLQNSSLDYAAFQDGREDEPTRLSEIQQYLHPKDEAKLLLAIDVLTKIRDNVRGSEFNIDGTLKTPVEYQIPKVIIKNKRKKRKTTN